MHIKMVTYAQLYVHLLPFCENLIIAIPIKKQTLYLKRNFVKE